MEFEGLVELGNGNHQFAGIVELGLQCSGVHVEFVHSVLRRIDKKGGPMGVLRA